MKTRFDVSRWLVSGALLLIGFAANATEPMPTPATRLVYHVDYVDPVRQMVAMLSVENHIRVASSRRFEIVIVLHGDGVTLLQNANGNQRLAGQVDKIRRLGGRFLVSAISLRRWNLTADNLYKTHESDVIPNGLVEIAERQMQGFIYIKP